jgi:hypothetical protein
VRGVGFDELHAPFGHGVTVDEVVVGLGENVHDRVSDRDDVE